jgi:hypothetical protein
MVGGVNGATWIDAIADGFPSGTTPTPRWHESGAEQSNDPSAVEMVERTIVAVEIEPSDLAVKYPSVLMSQPLEVTEAWWHWMMAT